MIASIKRAADVDAAIAAPIRLVFVIGSDINAIGPMVDRLRAAGKQTFVHIDLLGGLSSDQHGLAYLAQRVKPDGIISTRGQIVRAAMEQGLMGILRIFVMDTAALESGIRHVISSRPTALEVMPSSLPPWVIQRMREECRLPVVMGGLVKTLDDVERVLQSGAAGVSASAPGLWTAFKTGLRPSS